MSAPGWQKPQRCRLDDDGCDCPECSYACGYEDARQEAMGAILAAIDTAREMNPPRRTPTKRAFREYADALDKMAAADFDGWRSFVAEVRRQSRSTTVH